MDMIERAARALWEMGDAGVWEDWIPEVRAVLAAIREPSEAMIAAGEQAPCHDDKGDESTPVWQAMIDAALNPPAQPAP